MSDPLRTDSDNDPQLPSIDGDAKRDAKIESLLLSGLDHYFAADYAQAIDVWTRALFLDRQHALGSWEQLRAMMPLLRSGSEADSAPVRAVEDPVMIPRSSETAIDRARELFASGRLHDALRAVALVRATDPLRGDADKLKAAIQRELLAHHPLPGGAALTQP